MKEFVIEIVVFVVGMIIFFVAIGTGVVILMTWSILGKSRAPWATRLTLPHKALDDGFLSAAGLSRG